MMSLAAIVALSDEAARKAAREKRIPYALTEREIESLGSYAPIPFPFIGDYCPPGWEPVQDGDGYNLEYFVDTSGWGADDEPALSLAGLRDKLRENIGKGYGYALTEMGQFQGYLGVFRQIEPMPQKLKRRPKAAA